MELYVYISFKIRLQKIKSKCKDVSWHMYIEYQEFSLGHFILQISLLFKGLEKTDANQLKQLQSKRQTCFFPLAIQCSLKAKALISAACVLKPLNSSQF